MRSFPRPHTFIAAAFDDIDTCDIIITHQHLVLHRRNACERDTAAHSQEKGERRFRSALGGCDADAVRSSTPSRHRCRYRAGRAEDGRAFSGRRLLWLTTRWSRQGMAWLRGYINLASRHDRPTLRFVSAGARPSPIAIASGLARLPHFILLSGRHQDYYAEDTPVSEPPNDFSETPQSPHEEAPGIVPAPHPLRLMRAAQPHR